LRIGHPFKAYPGFTRGNDDGFDEYATSDPIYAVGTKMNKEFCGDTSRSGGCVVTDCMGNGLTSPYDVDGSCSIQSITAPALVTNQLFYTVATDTDSIGQLYSIENPGEPLAMNVAAANPIAADNTYVYGSDGTYINAYRIDGDASADGGKTIRLTRGSGVGLTIDSENIYWYEVDSIRAFPLPK
jgi:hypothetical protein